MVTTHPPTLNEQTAALKQRFDALAATDSDPESQAARAYQETQIINDVLTLNKGWATMMVNLYASTREEFAELRQAVSVGMIDAFRQWNPSLSSYTFWAGYAVRSEIRHSVMAREYPTLRPWQYGAVRKVRRYRHDHPGATPQEVCREVGVSEQVLSLIDTPLSGDPDIMFADHERRNALTTFDAHGIDQTTTVAADPIEDLVEQMDRQAMATRLAEVIEQKIADPRHRQMLTMMYELEVQQKDIAARFGVTRETIRRWHGAALETLRGDLTLRTLVQSD